MLRFVCMQLVTREEDQWGLRLYFGDRDEVRVSKMHNFDNSDKLVVCLTREFIDDTNYLATAIDSTKPMPKYIFVLFVLRCCNQNDYVSSIEQYACVVTIRIPE